MGLKIKATKTTTLDNHRRKSSRYSPSVIPEFDSLKLSEYSDEELLGYIRDAELLFPSECRIKVLSPTLVAKPGVSDDELAGIDMAEALSIPVPAVRCIIRFEEGFYIVMDRIHGPTLDEALKKLVRCAIKN